LTHWQRMMKRILVVVIVLEKEKEQSEDGGESKEKPDPIWKPPSCRAPILGSPSSHLSPVHHPIHIHSDSNSLGKLNNWEGHKCGFIWEIKWKTYIHNQTLLTSLHTLISYNKINQNSFTHSLLHKINIYY